MGICPFDRASTKKEVDSKDNETDNSELIPLATWLAKQQGIDFHLLQRQGHTPLHKVSFYCHEFFSTTLIVFADKYHFIR